MRIDESWQWDFSFLLSAKIELAPGEICSPGANSHSPSPSLKKTHPNMPFTKTYTGSDLNGCGGGCRIRTRVS